MKISRLLIPAAAVALLLTGCTTGSTVEGGADAPDDCLAPGAASKSVKVSGEFGEELTLESKTPLEATELERSVLIKGESGVPEPEQNVHISLNFFNGTNGELIEFAPTSPAPFVEGQLNEWAYEAIRCAAVGQRVAMAMPASVAFAGGDPSSAGLTETDAVVAVLDVSEYGEKVQAPPAAPDLLEKATGEPQAAPDGFPTVELAENGEPTITIPEGLTPPESLEIATLIKGDGDVVQDGDQVWVHYRGIIWRTGEEFDSSWSRGGPIDFNTNGVIGGFQKALVGQTVGSQVISVVPAEDGGYGAAQLEGMGHEGDDVMVFVLDILGAQSSGA